LFLFLFSSGTALLTFIFAPYIVYIVFGAGFLGAVPLLKIYIWSNIATALNAFTLNYLVIENKRKTIFISSFVGMALNVILNIILIPQYGSVGSAVATLVSYSSLFLFIFTVKGSKNIFFKYT
jgi:O-antigen/teichoic acid export membrane protein